MNAGKRADGRREYELALRSADDLAESHRAQLKADYFAAIGAPGRAIAPLEAALHRQPLDQGLETSLTDKCLQARRAGQALESARRGAANFPAEVITWTNLAGAEVMASDFDRAAEVATRARGQFPYPLAHGYVYLAVAESLRGHGAQAADAYRKLAPRDVSLATRGLIDLALAEGRLVDAEATLREGQDAGAAPEGADEAARRQVLLAQALIERSLPAAALAAARKAIQATEPATLYQAAEVEIEAGDVRGGALGRAVSRSGPPDDDDAHLFGKLLEAEALRRGGKAAEAASSLGESRIGDSWLGHVALARAYLDLGEPDLAERELRVALDRRGEGALTFGSDAPSARLVPPVTYDLARALEAQRRPEAKATYEAFLALVRDGQGEPLAIDARKRLSRL